MKSTFLSLGLSDLLKGAIMAAIVPVLTVIQQSVTAGELIFNWKSIGIAAIAGFVGYLLKNLFTDGTKEAVTTLAKQNVTMIEPVTEKPVTPDNVKELQTKKP